MPEESVRAWSGKKLFMQYFFKVKTYRISTDV